MAARTWAVSTAFSSVARTTSSSNLTERQERHRHGMCPLPVFLACHMKIFGEHVQSKKHFCLMLCSLYCIFLHCIELCPVLFLRKLIVRLLLPLTLLQHFHELLDDWSRKNPNEHPFRIFWNCSETFRTHRKEMKGTDVPLWCLQVPLFPVCVLLAVPFKAVSSTFGLVLQFPHPWHLWNFPNDGGFISGLYLRALTLFVPSPASTGCLGVARRHPWSLPSHGHAQLTAFRSFKISENLWNPYEVHLEGSDRSGRKSGGDQCQGQGSDMAWIGSVCSFYQIQKRHIGKMVRNLRSTVAQFSSSNLQPFFMW